MNPIFAQALAPWTPPDPPITLSSGRTIVHTREPNGSQRATPTTGDYALTRAEWAEYTEAMQYEPK